jgi:diadenylate cyclase
MSSFFDNVDLLWDRLVALFSSFAVTDILDIALVAFLVFNAIKMLRETRGIQIVKGLILLGVVYFIIDLLNMQASTYLFKTLLSDFIIVVIILFTPEIRHALETMGRRNFAFLNFFGAQQGDAMYERNKKAVLEVCKACNEMSEEKIGALIVFERNTMLGDVIKTGTLLDAKITRDLVGSIFFPNSPLHDGGLVIRDGKAYAAACIFPLSDTENLSSHLGTRHRAAVGITEKSDAVAIVVSEETGHISIAYEGYLERNVSDGVLLERIMNYILPQKNENDARSLLSKILAKTKREKGSK